MTIILPIKNEKENLINLVSEIPSHIKVYAVFNGTTDGGDDLLIEWVEKNRTSNIEILHSTPGKCNAINVALAKILDKNEFVLHLDSDIRLDKDFWSILNSKSLKDYKLIGALDLPTFDKNTYSILLKDYLKFEQISRVARGRKIVIGRCFGYSRELIDFFPENIHSEDNWITFDTAAKYGWDKIKVFQELKVSYQPVASWETYLKQKIRFEQGFSQIMDIYPEFKHIYDARRNKEDKFDQNYYDNEIKKLTSSKAELIKISDVIDCIVDDSMKLNISINDVWSKTV